MVQRRRTKEDANAGEKKQQRRLGDGPIVDTSLSCREGSRRES